MALAPGTRLGPYEVLAPLGAGGMGEVFRARDTRLGRDVAVKVLPDHLASDKKALARFETEAKAVAALSHSNILSLFDVGESGGIHYAVTELLEGETLRALVARGAIPVKRALEIAHQIAEGLATAHEKGVVHRDLKPENLFLTKDGHAKILDFGLARHETPFRDPNDTHSPTVSAHTEAGAVLGTVAYMSPEQASGKPVDHRSDQFSFGTVLYEMLSGRRPFKGASAAETLTAIIREEPEPLERAAPSAPPHLRWIVERCLAKESGRRYDSTRDLARELEASRAHLADLGTGGPAPRLQGAPRRVRLATVGGLAGLVLLVILATVLVQRRGRGSAGAAPSAADARVRIVVLPFENLGSPDEAYFAAGMAEEITGRLANVRNLAVISRTTATQYDRKGKTVDQIGKDLHVSYVLEGSVRWEHGQGHEGRVRIAPQLIRVSDDTHVWADRYDRVIADVFTVQSEVAENAVKAMGVALLPQERTALKEASTNDMEAYDLFLRGQDLYNGGEDRRHTESALRMYAAAVNRDPRFAQALASLAKTHLEMYGLNYDRSPARLVKAKAAAERAVELRPDLAETHAGLGWYHYKGRLDYAQALREFSAALEIQPRHSDSFFGIGAVQRRQGRWEDSADTMSEALELDPANGRLQLEFGSSCVLARRYAAADRAFDRAIAASPQWAEPYAARVWLEVQWRGGVEAARAALEATGKVGGLRDDEGFLAQVAFRLGLARRDWEGVLRLLEAESAPAYDGHFEYSPVTLRRGLVQMLAGQHDRARGSFEAARVELAKKIVQDPTDARFHGSLGTACAGLGRTLEAVQEAKAACDLMPASTDAWRAFRRIENLALVYAMVGQTSEAITQLDDLLARGGYFTPHVLRLDPRWDPLRSDPRFQALLTKYEVKP